MPNFPKCKLKNVSKSHVPYLGKWKEEEDYFAKKNLKISISAFFRVETVSRKNEKIKKGQKLLCLPHSRQWKAEGGRAHCYSDTFI